MKDGAIDSADDGHDKASWRAWLNANGVHTLRKRPWTKKSFNRMLARLRQRNLLGGSESAPDSE